MKKKLCFLFGIVLLITCCSYNPSLIYNRVYQYGNYKFKQLDSHSVSFCGFASDQAAQTAQAVSRTFVIPETIYGQPVTKIEREAFMSSTLFDQIVVPKTVTVIGRAAFYNCSAKISASGNILRDEGHLSPLGDNANNEGNNNGNGNHNGGNNSNYGSPFEQYVGQYSGTYSISGGGMGQQNGNWRGVVDKSGRMTVTFDNMPQSFSPILTQTGDFSSDGHNGPPLRGSIRNGHVTGVLFDTPAFQQQMGTFEGHRS
ncbi:hypothetical protein [Treponema sp.]|uniref:hypothetical protein n=1 Tax=Treponema sp. TaxID=166 RepID=UPI003FA24098